ncbi:MAG: hypothetical protein U9R37_02775 [Campylobacterota bacterium]|nr:hypothetical protein [Campylobacterota bacterium]
MLQDLLLPEDILQVDKLSGAIELTDDSSFLAIIGIDTLDLDKEFNSYIKSSIPNHIYHKPNSSKILNELLSLKDENNFIVVDMFKSINSEFIKDLLFYRDLISDNKLKIILIVNQNDYKYILKNAIDFYNINTYAYLFSTYKVDIIESVNRDDLDKLLKEYKTKKTTLSKIQKANYLYQIGIKYNSYGEIKLALKYLNEALVISNKLKKDELTIIIKHALSNSYGMINNYNMSERYLLDAKLFYAKNKNSLQYKQVLNSLVRLISSTNKLDLALKYNDELYQLSLNTKDKENELESLRRFLLIYNTKEDKANEDVYITKVAKLANQLNNDEVLSSINQLKTINYLKNKNYKKALIYADKCIEFYKKDKDIRLLNYMYSIVASIYNDLNDYNKSMIYSNWCYNYFKKHNLLDKLLNILQILSSNYQSLNQYYKSFDKLNEALKISKQLKLQKEEVNIYIQLSSLSNLQKDYSKSLEYLDKACNLANHISSFDYHYIYTNYANSYNNLNDLDNAYKYYNKAIESNKNLDDISNNAYLSELYGEILVNDEEYDEALKFFQDALNLAIKTNELSRILSVEENLAYLYKKLNNPSLSKRFFNEVINKLEIIDKNNPKIEILKKEII